MGSLGDFWSWACSDLANNVMRGVLAEYLVAMALGEVDGTRSEWDSVDIRTAEQWRIEVKSAAYLQSWAQLRPSEISFSIAPATGWDAQTGLTSNDVLRRSDVYVFCLLHHEEKQNLDPLDLSQWTFLRAVHSSAGRTMSRTEDNQALQPPATGGGAGYLLRPAQGGGRMRWW
ncbi:hypothetical protein [Streptomyces sp. NPDC005438]|uniref:hypothetical protein n=1 Tax=Streptomyces sp. NPDC005438 TaxID=3156880 RepID=UPI0033B8C3D0